MFIVAPGEGVSTCRSKGPTGELAERTFDCVIVSHGLQGKIKKMEVLKALPAFSGGELPGRSKVEVGREEEEEGQKQKMEKEVMNEKY